MLWIKNVALDVPEVCRVTSLLHHTLYPFCLPQLIRFSGVALGEACTIVIRGATQQILDESERSLHDALCVLQQTVKETRIVYGGGE